MEACQFIADSLGLSVFSPLGLLRADVYGPEIIRIRYTLENNLPVNPSFIVTHVPQEPADFSVSDTGNALVLTTASLRLEISMSTLALSWHSADGSLLFREPRRGGKTLMPVDVEVTVFDGDTEVRDEKSVDGIRTKIGNLKTCVDRKAYHTKLEFEFQTEECIYGFGSHEDGILNYRGHHQYLYQHNMKAMVPVMMSSMGYGILVDTNGLMTFHDDAHGSYIWTDVDDVMDFYVMYGPSFDSIVSHYRTLTGTAPMLPRWSYGFVQSKERYTSAAEMIEVVAEYRRRGIPLDMIVLDWRSWSGDLWGQKSFDPERFPDPEAMMQALHAMDAKLMISVWPIMRNGGSNHREMLENGYMLGNRMTYNAFLPEARDMYWKHANEGLFSKGVDAWWCDCTEPFEADWSGILKPEPEARVAINTGEGKKYLDPEFISIFSLLHSGGIYQGQRSVTDRKRVLNLTRSSYAGQHRYAAVTWSGDICSRWDVLHRQIADGCNFSVTGEPYWSFDIGGFFAGGKSKWSRWCDDPSVPAPWFLNGDYDGGVDDLGYRELYTRWYQFGAFLPMFRSHGTDTPREIWQFGEPGTPFYDTIAAYTHLRYRLMPYIYALAGRVSHDHYTFMRMLAFDFPKDAIACRVADQFFFGSALMVCPVTNPMYYDVDSRPLSGIAKTRPVYLPQGPLWYDFWTGVTYRGGTHHTAAAPLETLPLFVPAGTILPMGPMAQHTGEGLDGPLTLRVYPGQDGSFRMYEDEGDNYDYEKGAFCRWNILWSDAARTLQLTAREGSYPGMPESREIRVVLVDTGKGTGLDQDVPDCIFTWKGEAITLKL